MFGFFKKKKQKQVKIFNETYYKDLHREVNTWISLENIDVLTITINYPLAIVIYQIDI